MAAAKLVVTRSKGGSRIALVGASGTELLASKVFTEPRGKGATLRSLKGLLGEGIVVEDHTANDTPQPAPVPARRTRPSRTARKSVTAKARGAAKARRSSTRKPRVAKAKAS
jgi:hypothetical protein